MTAKKLHIKTWGCQMNVYDSERMVDVVSPLGFSPSEEADGADLVILNTCHIREKASEKLFSELGRLRSLQENKAKNGERMMIAVAGCVAQAEGAEIQRRAPYVDMVFGPQTYHQLPEMIAKVTRGSGLVLNTEFPVEPKFDQLPDDSAVTKVSSFVSVQEGCDKFCTFCVVPYTRGAEYSRPVRAILDEVKRRVDQGAREIVLLGQNVNAFHGDGGRGDVWGLGRLIEAVAIIDGVKRIRYTTSHPRDMDDELIFAHRDIPQLMPFLHLPIQSGSDNVLQAMNRKHTADDYRRVIDRLRNAQPDLALSSDFIVGFPGESDKDFESTLQLVRDIGFAQAFSFKYSRRPGTPAAAMVTQIAEDTKDNRLYALQDTLRSQQESFNAALVGKTVKVLIENTNRQDMNQVFGRTPFMQGVLIDIPNQRHAQFIGQEVDITITQHTLNSLRGRLPVEKAV